MTTKTKIIHQGEYMAEVEVIITYNDDEWSPYLSIEDVEKSDTVRFALCQNDLETSSKLAIIYRLTPINF